MTHFHGRSETKRTGGRRRANRDKRKYEVGRFPAETELGDPQLRTINARGGVEKVRALKTDTASVTDGTGETSHLEIEDVIENAADPNYARRNIITKGAIIATELGEARVTSRPGQDGQVNAVLLDEE